MLSSELEWSQRFIVGLFMLAVASATAFASEPDHVGLRVALATDKSVYSPDEPIMVTFEIENLSTIPVTLDFASAQRFDLAIMDANGSEIWRWSTGHMFAQMLGQEVLGPEQPRLTYIEALSSTLDAGQYRIDAWLTDSSEDFSATLGIEVR
jgi:hypothetical protein